MDFLTFKESVNQKKVHVVSGKELVELDVVEPTYLLKTSGSISQKSYLHTLSNIEASVKAFFKIFSLTESDCWGVCLSRQHVSGFSILVRTYFGKLRDPYFFNWSVGEILNEIKQNKISILSLVPTQIFDLVSLNVRAPEGIKYVFVGGAAISKELFDKAKNLGWPLVSCYGSTETFAQMSYSTDGEIFYEFPGWKICLSKEGELRLKGPGLYWAELKNGIEFVKRQEGWFFTGDKGFLKKNGFEILGKTKGLVKIKASYFDFNKFKKGFYSDLLKKNMNVKSYFPVVLEEERNGMGLYLIVTLPLKEVREVLEKHSELRGAFKVDADIFSEIGKLNKTKLEGEILRTVVTL